MAALVDPTDRDTRAYWLLDDEVAVKEAIRTDLRDIAADIAGPAPALLRSAHITEPQSYGGNFPAAVVYRMTTEGNSGISEAQEKLLARIYVAHIMVVYPAHALGQMPTSSARGVAEQSTDMGMSAWLSAIAENHWLHSRCTGIGRGNSNSGSLNNLSQPMFLADANTVAWANMMELGFIFGSE